MDLDAVAEELYGLRPEQFIAARSERAAAARSAGERALAEEIDRLRRPSLSAWAGNILVREERDQVQPLIDLGQALRRAHRDLDGEQLRPLVHQQRMLIGALSRQAAQLAADAGHPIGQDAQREVRETLQAVLADPDAARQWASGRLAKPLSPTIGFPATTAKPPRRRTGPPTAATEPPPSRRSETTAAEKRHRQRLDEARHKAEEADRDLRAREAEAEEATRQARGAEERRAALQKRVEALTQELSRTEKELEQARADERTASEQAQETGRQVRHARRRAKTAATSLERLASRDSG
ncbi:hypothetical protein OHB14_53380 [Streptomyces sp. NBC_01613]|uniref:hypothetical protein n=1 Tax=Streptomyces sp. NBC_01613 TaxID=2975896 RepID=UPI0038636C59